MGMIAFYVPLCYNDSMNKFKFPFSKLLYALIYIALGLCLIGFIVNIWRLIYIGVESNGDYVQYAVLFLVTVFFPVVLISMLFGSKYIVTQSELILQFGILKNKYKLDNISSVVYPKSGNKLTLNMKDGTYTILLVPEESMNDFVSALRQHHPAIEVELYHEEA